MARLPSPSRPRAYSPPVVATISLSVERRGFARRLARGPAGGCLEVQLASPRGSRPEEQETVPRPSRQKRCREHHPAGCSAAVTFNPLSAERRHVMTGRAGAVRGLGRVGPAAELNVLRWPARCLLLSPLCCAEILKRANSSELQRDVARRTNTYFLIFSCFCVFQVPRNSLQLNLLTARIHYLHLSTFSRLFFSGLY